MFIKREMNGFKVIEKEYFTENPIKTSGVYYVVTMMVELIDLHGLLKPYLSQWYSLSESDDGQMCWHQSIYCNFTFAA